MELPMGIGSRAASSSCPHPGCDHGTATPLFNFLPEEGAHLASGLVRDSDGNLYGAAPFGGANGYGSIYKLTFTDERLVLFQHARFHWRKRRRQPARTAGAFPR